MNRLTLPLHSAPSTASFRKVLMLYPSQVFCSDPHTAPIVVKTQLVKFYTYFRQRGIDVRVLDLELELGRPQDQPALDVFLKGTEDLIAGEEYDLVGISCYASVSYVATLEVAGLVRRLMPKAVIAVGGYHCLGDPADFTGSPEIDHVVRGDGLGFFDALLAGEALPRVVTIQGTRPVPPLHYEEYPYRYREGASIANVQLSRGCPFKCAFCSEPYTSNGRYVPMEVDDALETIDRVVRSLDPDKLVIEDLIFGFAAKWRHEFLKALAERNYRQLFWAEMRADTLDDATCALLSRSNFEITIGLETASPRMVEIMKKAKYPERYLRGFREAALAAHNHEVPITFSFMLNFPGETHESFVESMDTIEAVQDSVEAPHFKFDFFPYSFYPGNDIYDRIDELEGLYGTIVDDRHWYARRDGRMLEVSGCRVPSAALAGTVGSARLENYFRDRVERIQARGRAAETVRCRLVRAWRFVATAQRRLPELRDERFYARGLTGRSRERARSMADLASVHQDLSELLFQESHDGGVATWASRKAAWDGAFDLILERIPDTDVLAEPTRLGHVMDDLRGSFGRLATQVG